MADATYQPKVYRKQGGTEFVVASGGEVNIETGGIISANGTQAANIAAVTATATFSTAIHGQLNSVITALEGVGILATS
jgi:hypothetical protein